MPIKHLLLYLSVFLISCAILLVQGPIPQDPAYHNFADQRHIGGIQNFWNVVSNVPMFFLGIYGLNLAFQHFGQRADFTAKWIPVVLALGIFTASIGSAYYHYNPNNETLVWDRLPMTLMFMSVFSLIAYDLIGPNWGRWAFVLSIPLGIFSIWYCQITEAAGHGDLRPYAFVQFFPMAIAPVVIWLSNKKTTYIRYIWFVIAWYGIAKVFEHFDRETYQILGFWSGHTIKHLLGALSLVYLLMLVRARDAQHNQPQFA